MTQHLFEDRPETYASARPTYPDALYDWLEGLLPGRRERAWDVGTGTGQAAWALATRFDHVLATDVSGAQLERAGAHPHITYHQAPAHACPAPDASLDLITAATAAHWFDLPAFMEEAERVLRPGGILAIWGYSAHGIDAPEVLALTQRYAQEILGPYWERGNLDLLQNHYAQIPFPFDPVDAPAFEIQRPSTFAQYTGYLRSWSASQTATRALGRDPLEPLLPELERAWPGEGLVTMTWPLSIRVGRKERDASQ